MNKDALDMVHFWTVTSLRGPSSTSFSLILLTLLSFLWTETLTASSSSSQGPIVTTKYGPLKGIRLQFSSSSVRHLDPVTAYLGIPYASPPINAYRFMPPVAPLPWRETRPATTPPPACPQRFPDISNKSRALAVMTEKRYIFLSRLIPALANQSEDCLYLNFYVPTGAPGDDARPGRFPVVLVIHGESWEWGSGNEFDGAALSSLGNHIVVTFNYRLGPLGFLKTSNQQSNFGLLDVIAALHWVKENADSFGGDKNRITLLGYRTGAVVANLLLVAQIAKGLFQRAILISGSVLSPWALQRRPEEVARQLSSALGCVGKLPLSHPESDLAPCLRKKHLSELLSFTPSSPKFLSPYAPYVDNNLLNNPRVLMEGSPSPLSDQFIRAELLLLFTSSEGVHELNDHELRSGFESDHRDKILRTLVRNVFSYHQQEIFSIIRNEYTDWERPILHPIPLRDATVEALSDAVAIGPCLQVAGIHARKGAKTWVMHFSHVSKDAEFPGYERLGSLEGDIVPYVMGLPITNNIPALAVGGAGGSSQSSPFSFLSNFSKQDAFVTETLVHYLANFIKTGDPNHHEPSASALQEPENSPNDDWVVSLTSRERQDRRRLSTAPTWDAYTIPTQLYLSLGTKPRMKNHYRGHKMALWLNLIPQIHLPGGSDVVLSHHAFSDDNPNLYIGPVRPLSAYSLDSGTPGFAMLPPPPQTMSPGGILTTTECLESTESPLSQGTRHSVLRIDSNEVEVEIRGSGSLEGIVPLSSSPGIGGTADYDYTTALTVTITVGVCLILLNLVVFSAIMCHRKRGIPTNNGSGEGESDNESRTNSVGGTPQKGGYQEDYKWSTSCCSSGMHPQPHPHPGPDFPSTHLSSYGQPGPESVAMSQYHHPSCDHAPGPGSGGTLPRSSHSHHHYETSAGGGTLKRAQQQSHFHQMSIPDCVQPVPNAVFPDFHRNNDASYDHPHHGSAIRLYMNAGENMLDIPPPPEGPAPLIPRVAPTPAPQLGRGPHPSLLSSTVPSSSPSATNTTNSTSSNPSPNSGSTTLVGVLKRSGTSTTPSSSSVKKRVQIQEISV